MSQTVDDVIRAETAAEVAIRRILEDLQQQTGRIVDAVFVDTPSLHVQVTTISKAKHRELMSKMNQG